MKKYILFFVFYFVCLSLSYSQIDIEYYDCTICGENEVANTYDFENINSDFGIRRDDDSMWHRGIDLNLPQDTDEGCHILSPVTGTVSQLDGAGYKIIVIQDDSDDNYDFGFGHIFNDQALPITVGDLVLVSITGGHAIINTTTDVAISNIDNHTFTYTDENGDDETYTTTDQVDAGQVIAPIGGSGGFTAIPHLHLYRTANPNIDPQNLDNAKDPLEILNFDGTQYNITFEDFIDLTEKDDNTFYAGSETSTIKIGYEMINPSTNVLNSTNQTYSNTCIDIDDIDIFIKQSSKPNEVYTVWGNANSNYKLFQGPNYSSGIKHGARIDNDCYPSIIRTRYGNESLTGFEAHAYRDNPYDYFYFADVVTRIHKDDIIGDGTVLLAQEIHDARIKDGVYSLYTRITTVKDHIQTSDTDDPREIVIDNFLPYIKKVEYYSVVDGNYTALCSAGWSWDGTALTRNDNPDIPIAHSEQEIQIRIYPSEDLETCTLYINNEGHQIAMTTTSGGEHYWEFPVPKKLTATPKQLRISGTDLAGNELITNPHILAVRGENGWPVTVSQGDETYYQFEITDAINPEAGFTYAQGADYKTIEFTNTSTPHDDITNYNWSFGDGGTSNFESPTYIYSEDNTYEVILNVIARDQSTGSHSENIKIQYIEPPEADFTFSINPYETNQFIVDFYDNTPQECDSYSWVFDDGQTSTEKNPQNIIFDIDVPINCTLTVVNGAGSDAITKRVFYDLYNWPYVSCFWSVTTGYTVSSSINVFNLETTGQYHYFIDFGDGQTLSQSSDFSSLPNVVHPYNGAGEYYVKVTVTCDGNEEPVQTIQKLSLLSTTAVLNVNLNISSADDEFYPNAEISFDATLSNGTENTNYYWFWYIYDGNSASSEIVSWKQGQSTGKPTDISTTYMYPSVGNYKVQLFIYNEYAESKLVEKVVTITNADECINLDFNGNLETGCFWNRYEYVPIYNDCVDKDYRYPNHIRWTLFNSHNTIVEGPYTVAISSESQYIKEEEKYFDILIPQEGESRYNYKVRLEGWNTTDPDWDDESLCVPANDDRLSYYNVLEKTVVVDGLHVGFIIPFEERSVTSNSPDKSKTITFKVPAHNNPIEYNVKFYSKTENGLDEGVDWITPKLNTYTIPVGTFTHSFTFQHEANNKDDDREAIIELVSVNCYNSPLQIDFTQYGNLGAEKQVLDLSAQINAHDLAGSSVAIDGNVAVVGAHDHDYKLDGHYSSNCGAAFVFEKEHGVWNYKGMLTPSNYGGGDTFGGAVDISGEYIIVGAKRKWTNNEGAAYIFKRPASGWTNVSEHAYLSPDEIGRGDWFGGSVAISGDWAVVGAKYDDEKGDNAGAAYIFHRDQGGNDTWGKLKKIVGSNINANDVFGEKLDICGDHIVVGAPKHNTSGGGEFGSAYFYNRNHAGSNTWAQVTTVNHPHGAQDDYRPRKFGWSISIDGDNILIGSSNESKIIDWTNDGSLHYFQYNKETSNYEINGNLEKNFNWLTSTQEFSFSTAIFNGSYFCSQPDNGWINSSSDWPAILAYGSFWKDDLNVDEKTSYFDNSIYDGAKYGYSMQASNENIIIGFPYYDNPSANVGGAVIKRFDDDFSLFDLEYSFVNFVKLSGTYPTVKAGKISIGGEGYQAKISSNAKIEYEANEIVLEPGFVADRESNFSATALELPVVSKNDILKSVSPDFNSIDLNDKHHDVYSEKGEVDLLIFRSQEPNVFLIGFKTGIAKIDVSISTVEGKNVFSHTYTNEMYIKLDMNSFQDGVYTIKVNRGNKVFTRNVLLQKI